MGIQFFQIQIPLRSEPNRKVDPWTGRPRTDVRTHGPTPSIASAFGDTDGEIFDQKHVRQKNISAESNSDRICFWPTKLSAETFSGRNNLRPEHFRPIFFSTETVAAKNKKNRPQNIFGQKRNRTNNVSAKKKFSLKFLIYG